MYKFKAKLWMEKSGRFVMGRGRAKLLSLIRKQHSLARAAKCMQMSYRHGWDMLRKMEEALGERVVETSRGGAEGGKTRLTSLGEEMLQAYKEKKTLVNSTLHHPSPSLTVDGIVLKNNKILLVKRKKEPFANTYALPGGFVEYGEKAEHAVIREIEEETGLSTRVKNLVGIYSDPKRDPRGHVVSVVYELRIISGKVKPGAEACEAGFFQIDKLPPLAFDHSQILKDYISSGC